MTSLRRCMDLLDRHRVRYTHTRHANAYRAREVALAEHVPAHRFAKTVVFSGDKYYGMAVIPADYMLDLDELTDNLGLGRVRLATEGEIVDIFADSEVGAMPPFGELYNLPLYLEESLADEKYLVFAAGTHRDSIHMRMDDYILIAQPLITKLACPEVSIH